MPAISNACLNEYLLRCLRNSVCDCESVSWSGGGKLFHTVRLQFVSADVPQLTSCGSPAWY